ncbi:MAG: enoyl-CoA hydratase/isomerase family protein [Acidimicrobiia bacterium]
MELDEIDHHQADGVVEIVLDRPEKLNAISARAGGTRDQILEVLARAEADESVGSVLLRGRGRAFSVGGDLAGNEPRETEAEHRAFLERAEVLHRRLRDSRLPIVAAVHGHCLGAALALVASCDFVLAATTASFALPEGRLGLIGASPLVPIIGRQWAKFMILTGEPIGAEQARELGLVLSVEPDDELVPRARDLARRLARLPREAVALNKRAVDAVADASGDAAGRDAGLAHDTATLTAGARAQAPDGRTFREILAAEGVEGLKRARAQQYVDPWLGARQAPSADGADEEGEDR